MKIAGPPSVCASTSSALAEPALLTHVFTPLSEIAIASTFRTRRNARRIRSGIGFGGRKSAEIFRQNRQPLFLLLVAAVFHDRGIDQAVVHGQRHRRGHALFGDLFEQQAVAQQIERRTAEVFGHGRRQKALRRRFLQQRHRRLFHFIGVLRDLRHFLLREVAEQIAKHDLFFGKRKIHNRLHVDE